MRCVPALRRSPEDLPGGEPSPGQQRSRVRDGLGAVGRAPAWQQRADRLSEVDLAGAQRMDAMTDVAFERPVEDPRAVSQHVRRWRLAAEEIAGDADEVHPRAIGERMRAV